MRDPYTMAGCHVEGFCDMELWGAWDHTHEWNVDVLKHFEIIHNVSVDTVALRCGAAQVNPPDCTAHRYTPFEISTSQE